MWDGELSRSYLVTQGVGQGIILSPTLYKVYMDGVLNSLAYTGSRNHISGCFLGTPTVADDTLVIVSSTVGLHHLLEKQTNSQS